MRITFLILTALILNATICRAEMETDVGFEFDEPGYEQGSGDEEFWASMSQQDFEDELQFHEIDVSDLPDFDSEN